MKCVQRRDLSCDVKLLAARGEFAGYGSTFNGPVDAYGDVIAPGAFANSLAERARNGVGLPMLLGHHTDIWIGTWLELREDAHGLYARGKLWVDEPHPNPHSLVAYRAMREWGRLGLSIGFTIRRSAIDETTGIRTLLEVDLWELSVVPFPANDAARIDEVRAGPCSLSSNIKGRIDAMPDGIADKLDVLMSAVEEFKATNDRRLSEIERRGAADPLERARRTLRLIHEGAIHPWTVRGGLADLLGLLDRRPTSSA